MESKQGRQNRLDVPDVSPSHQAIPAFLAPDASHQPQVRENAHICVDPSSPAPISEIIHLLDAAGFRVSVTLVSGYYEPELTLDKVARTLNGVETYDGVAAIKRFVDSRKGNVPPE